MFDVICTETCQGDNDFIFKKNDIYKCIEDKGMVLIIEDDFGKNTIFYKNEFKSFFKPIN